MTWLFQEPPRDPELGTALRRLEHAPQPEDAEALRRRILAAAQSRLAELRSPAPHWWEWISRWMPVAVPVGVAAVLAAGLLLPEAADLTTLTATTEVGADSTLVMAAFAESPAGGQLVGSLVAPENAEWLWQQAVAE